MQLDDEQIELHKGVVVYVPRGVKHKARGNLTVLTICHPVRGVLGDVRQQAGMTSACYAAMARLYSRLQATA